MAKPRRYQLRKEAVGVALRHPWIFRDQLSSAATVFTDGDWLRLVDGANRVIGYGIFEATGAIAVRMLRRGPAPPDAAWLRGQLTAAIAKREPLAARTNGIRLVNGESDGIPAVVVDRFGDVAIVASYSAGADALARYVALALRATVPRVVSRPARRRIAATDLVQIEEPPDIVTFTEDGLVYAVDLAAGQKTGAYLDLRGLRRTVATLPLAGARVLNLFAYTGMLGRAAEAAGAASIMQVDASERALAFAAAHHVTDASKHAFVAADIFDWLPKLDAGAMFDLVIVDPPAMTSSKAQVPAALSAYRRMYRAVAPHVAPGGAIVAACCTSRIERAVFHKTVRETIAGDGFALDRELPVEPDHPVGFPQADYLKIALWRRG